MATRVVEACENLRSAGTTLAMGLRAPSRAVTVGRMLAARLDGIAPTIFNTMSALAVRTGSVNLGQGFPDDGRARELLKAAQAAIAAGTTSTPPASAYRRCGRRSRATSSGTTGSTSTPTARSW